MSAGLSALLSTLGKLTAAPKTPGSDKRNAPKSAATGNPGSLQASAASPQVAPASPQKTPTAASRGSSLIVVFTRALPLSGTRSCSADANLLPEFEMAISDMAGFDILPGALVCLQVDGSATSDDSTVAAKLWVPFLVGRAWPSRLVSDGTLRATSRGLLYPDSVEVLPVGQASETTRSVSVRDGMLVRVVPCPLAIVPADCVAVQPGIQPCSSGAYAAAAADGRQAVQLESLRRSFASAGGAATASAAMTAALASHALSGLLLGWVDSDAAEPCLAASAHARCESGLRFGLSSPLLECLRASSAASTSGGARVMVGLQLMADASRLAADSAVSILLTKSGVSAPERARVASVATLARERGELPLVMLHGSTTAVVAPDAEPRCDTETASQPVAGAPGPPADRILEQVLRSARLALFDGSVFEGFALPAPRGVLLVGPPGTGKTLLASRVASHLSVPLLTLSAAGLFSHVIGETEARIRAAFASARARAPCVLFLDEVDALAPSREAAGGGGPAASESDARAVAALLACMDGLAAKAAAGTPDANGAAGGGVFVLAATNRAAAVDAALRRPGRLDSEVLVGAPGEDDRAAILRACLGRYSLASHLLAPDALQPLARGMHGYVGADIDAVAREAAACAVRRACLPAPAAPAARAEPPPPPPCCITLADVHAALRVVQPSALREVAVEVPAVSWGDIAGQADVKARLLEAVEWPLTHAAAFARMGIRPPRGVLLYGPPGCSKTLMAKAMASQGRMHFISVKGPELFSCYVGDSEKAVAEVFARARSVAPCVVFFDEFDALAGRRDAEGGAGGGGGPSVGTRVVSQLLAELDGITGLKQVVVVAATNRPDLIDPAVLRPGRIDAALYVGPPDAAAVAALVDKQLSGLPHSVSSAERAQICSDLQGFSGAEIVGIFRDASVRAVADCLPGDAAGRSACDTAGAAVAEPRLCSAHIAAAVAATTKQITPQMLEFYARFART